MASLTEKKRTAAFIISERNGAGSRDELKLGSGQNLEAGAVLGEKINTANIAASAKSSNTGGGTISAVTVGTSCKAGRYRIHCIAIAANGGTFAVVNPDGERIGETEVGTPFAGEIGFTISDGDPDFALDDTFYADVESTDSDWLEYNPANTDGSEVPRAILYEGKDATAEDKNALGIVRDAEVINGGLNWFTGATADQIQTGLTLLQQIGIIARPR